MRFSKAILKEAGYFLLAYAISAVIFMIVFAGSGLLTGLKVATGIYYLYLLPGFVVMLLFTHLRFIEKILIGGAIGYTLTTLLAYYLNVFANVSLDLAVYLPAMIIALSVMIRFAVDKRMEF